MNILLGTHPNSLSLLSEIKKAPFLISIGAEHVLRDFEVAQGERLVYLKKISPADLFKGKVTLERFYVEATERCGVLLCTIEASLQLRRQYTDKQPEGESLRLAVQPIPDGTDRVYYPVARISRHDGTLQVKMDMYNPETILDPKQERPFFFLERPAHA